MKKRSLFKCLISILLVTCMVFACGCSSNADDTSGNGSTASDAQPSQSTDSSETSSKQTTSRLTDDQIVMSGHLGNWSEKLDTINQAKVGKFTFAVQTDTHHHDIYADNLGKNIAALSNFVDLKFIANLGDLVRGYSVIDVDSPENMRACMDDVFYRFTNRTQCPVFLTVGNHDTNKMWCEKWADHTAQITPQEQYERIFQPLKQYNGDKMVTDDDGSYYYMDFPEDKVRVIMLNSANGTYDGTQYSKTFNISDKQVEWFKTEALNTDNAVIVMTHVPLMPGFPDTNSVPNREAILAAVQDFTNSGGQFIAYMYGHVHAQNVQVDESGHLHISFKNGGSYAEVVMIDTQSKVISTIGLGGIIDREYSYE